MHALEEKNSLTQELEKTRKTMDELEAQKAEIMKELAKSRLEIDNVKRQMLQQEIAYNIQQTDALTRSLSPNAVDPSGFSRSASHSSFDAHSLPRRANKSRTPIEEEPAKMAAFGGRMAAEQEWEKMQQAHVLANVQQAFDVSSDAEGDFVFYMSEFRVTVFISQLTITKVYSARLIFFLLQNTQTLRLWR